MKLVFFVPGPPVPKARARRVQRRGQGAAWITPKKTADYELIVFGLALASRLDLERRLRTKWPTDARYTVHATIYAKSTPRFDVDNVGKSILDGCNPRNGLMAVWKDDRQAIFIPNGFPVIDEMLVGVSVEVEVVGT